MLKTELTPNTKYYRYRLNDNANGDSAFVCSRVLTKNWGCEVIFPVREFNTRLRTENNKKGIIDVERFNSTTEEIYESSENKIKNSDIKLYVKQELKEKSISDIMDIAKNYSINIKNKNPKEIIDIILGIQNQILEKYDDLYSIYGV